jgi:pimeloyl-ACP methyl ester carboxylesterase
VSPEPATLVERFVEVSGRSVRVRVHGEGSPVLLINGLGANVAMWTPLLEQLGKFQVISFDAPGTGKSQAPLLPYTVSRIADVAVHVLDELGLERADVLGYSLGGGVAQQLALDHPERVRRLVLVSTSCGAGAIPGSMLALMAVVTPARHYVKSGYKVALKMVNLAPAEKDSTYLKEQTANWHHGAPPSVRGYSLQITAFSMFNSLPWLHRVKHPTLVLSGTDDRLVPMANSAVLAAYLPNARLSVFERWGHYLLHDTASGAGAVVADFLGADAHTASQAWSRARIVSQDDMAELVRAAPRSAHPSQFMNRLVRRLYRIQDEVD